MWFSRYDAPASASWITGEVVEKHVLILVQVVDYQHFPLQGFGGVRGSSDVPPSMFQRPTLQPVSCPPAASVSRKGKEAASNARSPPVVGKALPMH